MKIETMEDLSACLPESINRRINRKRQIYFHTNPPRLKSCEEVQASSFSDYFQALFQHSRAQGSPSGLGSHPWHTLGDYGLYLRAGELARLKIMAQPSYLAKDYVFPEPPTNMHQDDFQALFVAERNGSSWRRHLLEYLNGLIDLHIAYGPSLTSYDCQLIAKHPALISLDLYQTKLTDQTLQLLSPLKNLRLLSIIEDENTADELTANGYNSLINMEQLTQLRLGGRLLDKESMKQIGQLPNLEYLHIGNSSVAPLSFKYLANLERLETLDLSSCQKLNNEDIALLADLPTLKELVLPRIFAGNITEATRCFADRLPNLEYLTIYVDGQQRNLLLIDTLSTLPNLSDLKAWKV